jgi:ribosome biogenesis protein Nip4
VRPLTPEEHERTARGLIAHGPLFLTEWLQARAAALWTDGSNPMRLFLVARSLSEALAQAREPVPVAVGLFVGELEGDRVHLSLEGAHEVARRSRVARVVVGEKSAQLFLYGRDVFGEGIVTADRAARVGTVAIVVNRDGEALGLAKVLQNLPGRGRSLEPLADRGWYLRQGG